MGHMRERGPRPPWSRRAGRPPAVRPDTRILALLALGHMVIDINQGSLAPLLPFFKTRFALSYTAAGAILLVANLTSSLIQPIFGYLVGSQRAPLAPPLAAWSSPVHRRRLHGVGAVVPGGARARRRLGLGVAAYHPEGYKTAYQVAGDRKATGLSLFSIGGNVGIALGPPLITRW